MLGAVEANGHGLAVRVAADTHDIGTVKDVDKLALGIGIAGDYIVDGLGEAEALLVIGKGDGSTVLGHGSQLAAALPGIGPGAVGGEVANGIVGAGLAGIGGEQVLPAEGVVIAIGEGVEGFAQLAGGISIFDAGEDISSCIIGKDPGFTGGLVVLPGKLAEGVVGVGNGGSAVGDGEDIAEVVIGIGIGLVVVQRLVAPGSDLSGGVGGVGVDIGGCGEETWLVQWAWLLI